MNKIIEKLNKRSDEIWDKIFTLCQNCEQTPKYIGDLCRNCWQGMEVENDKN